MMRFVVDAQLPPRLADWLRARGHVSEHVDETLGLQASDSAIVAHSNGAVIVSKDGDFAQGFDLADAGAQLLWIRIGNCSNRALLEAMERTWPEVEKALMAGDPVVEIC